MFKRNACAHDKIDKSDKMDNPDMEKPESLQLPLQSDEKISHLIILKKSMMQCSHILKISMYLKS